MIKAIQELYSGMKALLSRVDTNDRTIAFLKAESADLKAKAEQAAAKADKAEKENAAIKAWICSKDLSAAVCH